MGKQKFDLYQYLIKHDFKLKYPHYKKKENQYEIVDFILSREDEMYVKEEIAMYSNSQWEGLISRLHNKELRKKS